MPRPAFCPGLRRVGIWHRARDAAHGPSSPTSTEAGRLIPIE
ncbi:hypothetical protein ACFFX0_11220 [Citricoccus parietis]|uniref:Uncharacterized protein n=1 Tax=Citricoccus parietis TaxID=592307 RepID=A0ABV5FYI7_9MICC